MKYKIVIYKMFTTLLQYLSDKQGGTQMIANRCNTIDWSQVIPYNNINQIYKRFDKHRIIM